MEGLDSVGLMAAAIRKADEDAGGGWLARCDWLANVQQMAFPGMDVLGLLPKELGIAPATTRIEKPPYGDAPIQLISDAANAVAAGEASVCHGLRRRGAAHCRQASAGRRGQAVRQCRRRLHRCAAPLWPDHAAGHLPAL
jgi:acetyl-CoA C-acetyltransferase